MPVREAVLNAVAHRDYRLGGSIFVRQFAKRLEVVSPGGLPPGITPENIIDQQNPRNRRLAEALARCGLIERSGQGLNLMVENAVRHGKPLPSFAGTAAHEVRLTLEGGVRNPAFVSFMEKLGDQALRSLSTDDFLTLDAVHREQPLTSRLKDRLPGLVSLGAIEAIGRGRGAKHLLSRDFHAALGAKGVYTRKKGLDRNTTKALLLRHIDDSASSGTKMEELQQVLPALPRCQIQVLLRELRKEGAVHSIGVTKGARWYPGPGSIAI
ncbi:ATP-binding protein [Xylophilus sp. Leaf220]|uniref:ATP-binding protein n=1 Tax=Xylophilus sp. Leaf220 TaxID=1735686 RepID=UPI001F21425D|nr:ATP-binding protein [Xylophilus sp. Leaf220]